MEICIDTRNDNFVSIHTAEVTSTRGRRKGRRALNLRTAAEFRALYCTLSCRPPDAVTVSATTSYPRSASEQRGGLKLRKLVSAMGAGVSSAQAPGGELRLPESKLRFSPVQLAALNQHVSMLADIDRAGTN
ncbi:hypothetical protein EVAR_94411_1 [Eumeta japonica]|uniref:Uncharacterized protein n=1 Tax=Eumeta variegata TaxID=151549 RepID=A0A4C1TQ16_EUMVA|nr:hypothetical protein EVAR_94411_1 [Eumeta japonica]